MTRTKWKLWSNHEISAESQSLNSHEAEHNGLLLCVFYLKGRCREINSSIKPTWKTALKHIGDCLINEPKATLPARHQHYLSCTASAPTYGQEETY